MTSLADTPRSRNQRSVYGSSHQYVTSTKMAGLSSAVTPKQPAKMTNPFSGESTCSRQNFPDFSPSVFLHKETPAECRTERRFQWSIDEMANLQPADIDEKTALPFHCTPKRDSAKQIALNRFFSQEHVVASPSMHQSSLASVKKTAMKHVTFSPLPPTTKYITRDDDMSSGDSSCESAMDVGDDIRRHSICTQGSLSMMDTDETLPPNCVQMESMAELKDMSYSSLRRKLFGPSDRGTPSPDSQACDGSPSMEDGDSSNLRRFESDEPAITPGQFLLMGSEDDSDTNLGVPSRRSWGRCSSSPTDHLGEECMGIYSSPVGLMEDPVFAPEFVDCSVNEDNGSFEEIRDLDLSPISPNQSGMFRAIKESETLLTENMPLMSTMQGSAALHSSFIDDKENEVTLDGLVSTCARRADTGECATAHQQPPRYPMTPLADHTNQPSTLRVSQLETMTTPTGLFSHHDDDDDIPMSHGRSASFVSCSSRAPLSTLQTPQTPHTTSSSTQRRPAGHSGPAAYGRDHHSWSYEGSTPVSRSQPPSHPASLHQASKVAALDDWQRSVDSWQDSIRQQLADFDRNYVTKNHQ